MVYVGKEKGFHTRTQDEIHELLCSFAQQGCTVLRLKGGDPYIFGRGGEEVEYLQQRGIKVHCIPGEHTAHRNLQLAHRSYKQGSCACTLRLSRTPCLASQFQGSPCCHKVVFHLCGSKL